jgi:hypothetical protein
MNFGFDFRHKKIIERAWNFVKVGSLTAIDA